MSKVLITGGAGFIGSHVAKRLIKKGNEVIIIDNLINGLEENIPKDAIFIKGNIQDDASLEKLPKNIDIIIHLAAQTSGEISFDDPVYDMEVNILGTLKLLEWAKKNKVKRFIYTSSMSVYGDTLFPWCRDELDRVSPKSFYGVGKIASEYYINIYHTMGLETVILRLFNVYGPGQNMTNLKQGMVSIYLAYIGKGEPILVKGSLERKRDFVYIEDVVHAIEWSMEDPRVCGKTMNIATGRRTTIRELLDIIKKEFGTPDHPILEVEGTPGDQKVVFGCNQKAGDLLGWKPYTGLEYGIRKTVNWVKEYYKCQRT